MIGVYVALLQTWEALGRDAFTDEPGKKKKKKEASTSSQAGEAVNTPVIF